MSIAQTISRAGHKVNIYRPVEGRDAVGGRVLTYTLMATDVPCWVQPASSETIVAFASRNLKVKNTVYFATDPAVFEGCYLLFGAVKLLVLGTVNQGGLNRLWAVYAGESK